MPTARADVLLGQNEFEELLSSNDLTEEEHLASSADNGVANSSHLIAILRKEKLDQEEIDFLRKKRKDLLVSLDLLRSVWQFSKVLREQGNLLGSRHGLKIDPDLGCTFSPSRLQIAGPHARQHEVHWTLVSPAAPVSQSHWQRDLCLVQASRR